MQWINLYTNALKQIQGSVIVYWGKIFEGRKHCGCNHPQHFGNSRGFIFADADQEYFLQDLILRISQKSAKFSPREFFS